MGSVGPDPDPGLPQRLDQGLRQAGEHRRARLNISDSDFWAPVSNGSEPTDPGVEYDRLSQRWIISAINTTSTNNRVMLAVSDGPDDHRREQLHLLLLQRVRPAIRTGRFADYPQLGVDTNAIYIGVNEFTSSSGSFSGTSRLRDSEVQRDRRPARCVVTGFRTLVSAARGGPRQSAASHGHGPEPRGRLLRRARQPGPEPDRRRQDQRPGRDADASHATEPRRSASRRPPRRSPSRRRAPSGGLDALDDRFFEAMIGRGPDGTDTLWTAHNIRVNSSGVGTASGDRDGARWYQLGSLSSDPPSLIQSGTMFDTRRRQPAVLLDAVDRDERPGPCVAEYEHRRPRAVRRRSRPRAGWRPIRSARRRPSS